MNRPPWLQLVMDIGDWLMDHSKNLTYLFMGMAAVVVFTVSGLRSGLIEGDVKGGTLSLIGIVFGIGATLAGVKGVMSKPEQPPPPGAP